MAYPNPTKEEAEEWKKENKYWKKEAVHYHNAIPNFSNDMRASFNKDVDTVTNIKQLELNKDLHDTIKSHNTKMFWFSVFNVIFAIINLYFFLKINKFV